MFGNDLEHKKYVPISKDVSLNNCNRQASTSLCTRNIIRLAREGNSVEKIAKYVGHSNSKTTFDFYYLFNGGAKGRIRPFGHRCLKESALAALQCLKINP